MSTFNRFLFILFISILSLFIALPKNFLLLGNEFSRNDISLSLGSLNFERSLDLRLGLDLQGGTHLLFEVDTTDISEFEKDKALNSLKEVVSRRVNLFGVSEPNIQRAAFEGKERIIVELPGIEETEEAIELVGKTAQLQFLEIGGEEASPSATPTNLTGADIRTADVQFDTISAQPVVSIEFTPDGAKKFEEITGRNIGNPVPIVLDNQVISAPVVQDAIVGGQAQISGNFSVEEAEYLAIQINGGALPAPMRLVEQNTVGPSLGQESIDKSLQAGVLGVVIVAIFMVLLYGKLGFVAVIGLGLFTIYTLALYKLIPVVLTLPGIAGFLLSIGMAVDANILIFERYREEIAEGVTREVALERGFGRAWDSIRDANIATLFTAFVLANPFNWGFLHTSGPVRGFAVTLALGILISLFTGVFVSRTLLRMAIKDDKS